MFRQYNKDMAGFKFPSFLRSRWLWALAGTLAAIPLFVLAWLYWWVFPSLPQYKDDIAGLLSSATGYSISIDALDGEWGGPRPRFALEGVRISRGGRPVLYFSKMEGSFGWRTLIALEPRFHALHVDAPGLTVRRAQDGLIHVGGITVDPASPDTSFSDWLLRQGEVRMQGVTVAWIDDMRDGQPLVLRDVSVQMHNLLTRHAVQLEMTPPARLARPLTAEGVLYGRSLSRIEEWRGQLNVKVPALELAAWRPWLPPAYAAARGHGGVEVKLGFADGRLSSSDLKLNLADLYLESPQLAAPVSLARLTGDLGWSRGKAAKNGAQPQAVYARGLALADRAGVSTSPFDFSYRWGEGEQRATAAHVSLTQLAALAHALPLADEWKARIADWAPQGRFDSLDARWQGSLPVPAKFSVDARFTGLGWAAKEGRPGGSNLSGMLAGNEEKGAYSIAGKASGFDFPGWFAEPQFRFDILNVRGGWKKKKDENYDIEIAEAALSNADFAATLYGHYRLAAKGPGYADLAGRVERANGPSVYRYLPLTIGEPTREWLRTAILRGLAEQGTFKLQGDLARFPFSTPAEGIFRVAGKIRGGQLRYAADYPQIDDIEGELLFDGVRMEIRSDDARIYGARLSKVEAVIPDLEAMEELLEVSGTAAGPAQEFIRFVNFSPVSEKIDGLTEEMTANGDLSLQMNIKVPLRHSDDTTLAGRLVFDRNLVYPGPDMPRMEQVSGTLDFTEQSVSAKKISARLLGGPAALTAATENEQVRVRGQGVFSAAALETWFGKGIAGRLSGQSGWKGELILRRGKPRFSLESNLVGLDARLPAPLEKTPEKPARFVFEQQNLDDGSKQSALQYGNIATAVWLSKPLAGGFRLERGELNFGGRAKLPAVPGMQIAGSVKNFDLGGWADILPQGRGDNTTEISAINLSLGSVELLGRQFNDINIAGGLRGNLLRTSVSGREMAGSITYRRAEGDGAARISAQFRQFILPDPLPYAESTGGAAMRLQAANFPALDLQVDELRFGSRPMGRLEVVAHGVPTGMAIDQLNLLHADSVIRMSGIWKDTGLGETRMKVNADIKDAGLMLGRFGYPGALRKGAATVEGEVTWLRSPADFNFDTLDGTLKLTAKNGQFLKVEPGAGKLLGIASLQSLPRRITLDFRDVFSEGFAFDEISSTMQVADGTVYTNDFLMKGPAASVKMSGMARLRDESVKLRVKVLPKISEGVAVAGALLGGPIAGVGALVAQKVLKDPFEEAISYEYMVDGPWESPVVTKLAKSKSVQE
ncbi:TIGR02099 family protein [Betaproteobacteria bacterium SCN2]|jgi:uncharacterized protein (TIGR02099 family)|nr:TIGR02099 family protein [Betaproteobacteria bacterium SCN2]